MSIIKSFFLFLLVFVSNPVFSAFSSNHIVNKKQEEILLELVELGNESSYHWLAELFEFRFTQDKSALRDTIVWRINSGLVGHVTSLHRLGNIALQYPAFKKYFSGLSHGSADNKKAWRQEGLILIGVAAILGNSRALMDLVLLPKMFDYSNHEVEQAIEIALLRIQSGTLINCDFINCPSLFKLNNQKRESFTQQASLFQQTMDQLNCSRIHVCLEGMSHNISFITKGMVDQYNHVKFLENQPKIRKNQRLEKEEELLNQADWDITQNQDRLKQRRLDAQKLLEIFADQDRKLLIPKIQQLIDKINFHRAPDQQIKLSDVMDILSRP